MDDNKDNEEKFYMSDVLSKSTNNDEVFSMEEHMHDEKSQIKNTKIEENQEDDDSIIIINDNDFTYPNMSKYIEKFNKMINEDKYNILDIFGDFMHKNSFDTTIFNEYNIEQKKYFVPEKYLGSFNLKHNDKNVNILIKSRFDDLENENTLNYFFEIAYDIFGETFVDSELSKNDDIDYISDRMLKFQKMKRVNKCLALFVYTSCLANAIKKGMFRQYNEREYNDTRIKGRIDVSRHIIKNQSIQGKVAYTTREYTPENVINRLILKTYIFFERNHNKLLKRIMLIKKDAQKQIVKLKDMFPNIDEFGTSDFTQKGNSKIVNPVYKEYEVLRKVCIGILKSKGRLVFDENDVRVTGIVIDIEKMWELFVYKNILRKIDEENREDDEKGKEEIRIMNSKNIAKHDFVIRLKNKRVIFDARYSKIWEDVSKSDEIEEYKANMINEELKEIIDFAKVHEANVCGIIFPLAIDGNKLDDEMKKYYEEENEALKKIKFDNVDIEFYKIPYLIPTRIKDYNEYHNAMKKINKKLIKKISKIIN